MKKIISLFLLLTTSVFAYDQSALMHAFNSVVMIRGYQENGSLGYGSGVIVGDNQIVTNCHVLRGTKKPWVSQGDQTFSIVSVKSNPWHDLCLIGTHGMSRIPAPLGSSKLKKNSEVVGIGHSHGAPVPLTIGGLIIATYPIDNGNLILSSAKFRLGASGSGLFNMQGELVGINTFKTTGYGSYYAVPVEWLKDLMNQKEFDEFPVQGKALWEEDEDKKPYYLRIAIPKAKEEWNSVERLANEWVKKEPNNTEAWYELGFAYLSLNKMDAAKEAFKKSNQCDKKNIDPIFELAKIEKNDDPNQAENYLEQLNQIDLDKAAELKEIFNK
ncbi:MAG: trypsin-like peptidase domain-containing protein [Methylophilaceae bacterium]